MCYFFGQANQANMYVSNNITVVFKIYNKIRKKDNNKIDN